jgi:hypothetical protein
MITFTFKCPITALTVQGIADGDVSAGPFYLAILCTACQGAHLVDPQTGELAGTNRDPGRMTKPASN